MSIPYKKILIPLDGSTFAEHVLAFLPRLAAPGESIIHLATIIEPARYAIGAPEFHSPNLITYIRSGMQEYINNQQAALQRAGYTVQPHLLDGDAAQCVLDLAQQTGVDLIAMTTHGRSGFVRWILGSVAERILQRAETPIFLVRGPAIAPSDNWQRILAPLDGSSLAEQALKPAITLAKMFNSQLILLQAVAELDVESQRILFPTPMAAEEAMTSWQAAAEEYLRSITKTLQERDGLNASYQAIVGEAGQVIAATVANSQIDLIVMSTHGRTGWQRWVYGSVANKVLRSAECPILLVRACPQQ